jgi:hypothetical protein
MTFSGKNLNAPVSERPASNVFVRKEPDDLAGLLGPASRRPGRLTTEREDESRSEIGNYQGYEPPVRLTKGFLAAAAAEKSTSR